jgi:hypothetical protein
LCHFFVQALVFQLPVDGPSIQIKLCIRFLLLSDLLSLLEDSLVLGSLDATDDLRLLLQVLSIVGHNIVIPLDEDAFSQLFKVVLITFLFHYGVVDWIENGLDFSQGWI